MLLFDEALISPTGLDELRLGALVIDEAVPSLWFRPSSVNVLLSLS